MYLLAVLLLLCDARSGYAANALKLDTLHEQAPSLVFQDDHAHAHNLKEYSGKKIVLHVWATWCAPCRLEIPELAKLVTEKTPNWVFLPMAIDPLSKKGDVTSFLHDLKSPVPVYVVDPTQSSKEYWSWGVPVTYFIDEKGMLVGRVLGAREWADLSKKDLNALLSIYNSGK